MLLGGRDNRAGVALKQLLVCLLLQFSIVSLGNELRVMVVVLYKLLVVGGQHRGCVVWFGLWRAWQSGGRWWCSWRGERGDR